MIATAIEPGGFTTQLQDHIEYLETEIHRKILIQHNLGQVILICLVEGFHLTRHTSAHNELITVIEGQGTLILDRQKIALEPGVFIELPANTVHSVEAISNLAFLKFVDTHNQCQEYPQLANTSLP